MIWDDFSIFRINCAITCGKHTRFFADVARGKWRYAGVWCTTQHVYVCCATAMKFFEFIVFTFSESLSGTYSPVQAVLSNKRGKIFSAITLTLQSKGYAQRGPGVWKFNTFLLAWCLNVHVITWKIWATCGVAGTWFNNGGRHLPALVGQNGLDRWVSTTWRFRKCKNNEFKKFRRSGTLRWEIDWDVLFSLHLDPTFEIFSLKLG